MTVKEVIVKEVLDSEQRAKIELRGGSQGTASPAITTAPTRAGLFYQFREGETLGGMGLYGVPWKENVGNFARRR